MPTMRTACILSLCVVSLTAAELDQRTISDVEMVGIPATVKGLETHAGEVLDPEKVRHDVKTLWGSQRFSDVNVETEPDGDAVRVVFRAQEREFQKLAKTRIEPPTPGITLGLQAGGQIDDQMAQQVATAVRKQLVTSGYPDAKVDAKLVPAGTGKADLDIHVDKGRQVDVGGVSFSGDLGATPAELQKALHTTTSKTMIPLIWHVRPAYSSDGVQSDVANLRSFYYKRGFFDAEVRANTLEVNGGKARINYDVDAGPHYRIREFRLGDRLIHVSPSGEFPADTACKALLTERREAERQGILDFAARIDLHQFDDDDGSKWADATATITQGRPYRTGRITFQGTKMFNQETLRRSLLLHEGAPLDQALLRKSLGRLNQTGFFEPLSEHSVVINTPPGADYGDVQILLKEKKKRSWSLSGPIGPMSVAGPLEFSLGTRLPNWGRGLFELSTYAVNIKLMYFAKPIGALVPFLPNKRFLPLITIERPMLPGQHLLWGSEFVPQLGWQGMLAGYGAAQTRDLLHGLFESERSYTPGLLVTIAKGEGTPEGTLFCEMAKTKLDWVKQIGGTATNLMFAFLPF